MHTTRLSRTGSEGDGARSDSEADRMTEERIALLRLGGRDVEHDADEEEAPHELAHERLALRVAGADGRTGGGTRGVPGDERRRERCQQLHDPVDARRNELDLAAARQEHAERHGRVVVGARHVAVAMAIPRSMSE
mgnify:CR=1 FL=1